jgi:hypothetical protein
MVSAVHAHNLALANRYRAGMGLRPGDTASVTVGGEGVAERLAPAGLTGVDITAATRADAARLSFRLYDRDTDVGAAVAALGTLAP